MRRLEQRPCRGGKLPSQAAQGARQEKPGASSWFHPLLRDALSLSTSRHRAAVSRLNPLSIPINLLRKVSWIVRDKAERESYLSIRGGAREDVFVRCKFDVNLRKLAFALRICCGLGVFARCVTRRVERAVRAPAASFPLRPPASSATFDYVIVGGGAAGCVLAARLSEDANVRVLLLEAGSDARHLVRAAPALAAQPSLLSDIDWRFRAHVEDPEGDLERSASGAHRASGAERTGARVRARVLPLSRGKTLGGTSALSSHLHVRGDPAARDAWAARPGCEGWGNLHLLPYFKRSESHRVGDARAVDRLGFRGAGGPTPAATVSSPRAATNFFLDAWTRIVGAVDDYNGASHHGASLAQVTVRDGRRCDAAWAYLTEDVLSRPNLSVAVGVRATRLTFEGARATGARWRLENRRGPERAVSASREIFVCAGAVGSPWLLQLSGVGPRDVLDKAGVPATAIREGVGRALAAPASVPCYFRAVERPRRASGTSSRASRASATSDVRLAHRSWRRSIFSPRKASQAARFALRFGGTSARAKSDVEAFFHKISLGGGFLARPPVEALAHVDDGSGEIQVLFTPALPSERSLRETPAADARAERVRALALAAADGCTVTVTATDTRARGFVELVSSDPIEPPRVVLGWTEDVVAATSRGVRLARRAMGPAFEMIGGDDDDASRDADVHEEGDEDDTLREYCASLAQCAHSVAGTCRMGPEEDEFAVVDASLRVIGVDGVRVVGEATAPTVHGAHSAALTVAIAERAAAMIREERTAVERDAVRRRLPRVPLETSVARVVDVSSAGTDDDKGANANADADSDANANADDARCDSPPCESTASVADVESGAPSGWDLVEDARERED